MPSMGGEYAPLTGSASVAWYRDPKLLALLVLSVLLLGGVIGLSIATASVSSDLAEAQDALDECEVELEEANGTIPAPAPGPAATWADAISIDSLMANLDAFYAIAMANNGSRAPQYGYNASAQYVMQQLAERAPVLQVTQEFFPVRVFENEAEPSFRVLAPTPEVYEQGSAFQALRGYSGPANVTGQVVAVPELGCTAADYGAFPGGVVALVKRGSCSFSDKVRLAGEHNATAVLIYNDGANKDRQDAFYANVGQSSIPSMSLAFYIGFGLAHASTPAVVELTMSERGFDVTTSNICAEAPWGDANNVIVVGSHLDGVEAGPGINDDGSGSTVNLEMAVAYANLGGVVFDVKARVRFCWWGAEELGLLGSRYYLDQLNKTNPAELAKIACNWNMDMLGSPNFIRQVHSGASAPAPLRAASTKIEDVANAYLTDRGLTHGPSAMSGGSDYMGFLEHGIPAGGVDTGAGGIKTPQQRDDYGGIANAAFDPCYHQACDTVTNVDQECLLDLAQTSAHTIQALTSHENLRDWLNGN